MPVLMCLLLIVGNMRNMQYNMQQYAKYANTISICRICTPHFADARSRLQVPLHPTGNLKRSRSQRMTEIPLPGPARNTTRAGPGTRAVTSHRPNSKSGPGGTGPQGDPCGRGPAGERSTHRAPYEAASSSVSAVPRSTDVCRV